MPAPKTLQTKLLISVFLVVTLTVTSLTALVAYVEKERFQKAEMERIFYKSDTLQKRLGHLMYGKNWRYLMITLSNAENADPSMVYFAITGLDGNILICDREASVGLDRTDLTQTLDPDHPLGEIPLNLSGNQVEGTFRISLAQLVHGRKGGLKGEVIFDVSYDIAYLGKKMGCFHLGFSRKAITQHLWILAAGMLGTGLLVLVVIMVMIFWVIRRHTTPVESFLLDLSGLGKNRQGQSLRDSLAVMDLTPRPGETAEIRGLKNAFKNIRDQFITSWEQLENHRNNLSQMVDEQTSALCQANEQLSRQIAERKEIEGRLLTVQKLEAIGTLAGGIAHEFNNLFMAIGGYASLVRKRTDPGHPNIPMTEKIQSLVETGAQSIQQLLGFARHGKYEPGPQNLNEVLRVSLTIFSRSRRGLAVDTAYAPDLWPVWADRSQMEQVIMNLLLNASEAMPGTGTLVLKTQNRELEGFRVSLDHRVSGNFVLFSVQDHGHGIDPEVLPRIFDPFFTTKEMGKGSGMGLASVYGIVENHGGFITVESEKDRGSLFCVFLPAQDTQPDPSPKGNTP